MVRSCLEACFFASHAEDRRPAVDIRSAYVADLRRIVSDILASLRMFTRCLWLVRLSTSRISVDFRVILLLLLVGVASWAKPNLWPNYNSV